MRKSELDVDQINRIRPNPPLILELNE